jgi:hypothetical protein
MAGKTISEKILSAEPGTHAYAGRLVPYLRQYGDFQL